jgi:hypothetical protein
MTRVLRNGKEALPVPKVLQKKIVLKRKGFSKYKKRIKPDKPLWL